MIGWGVPSIRGIAWELLRMFRVELLAVTLLVCVVGWWLA